MVARSSGTVLLPLDKIIKLKSQCINAQWGYVVKEELN